MADETNNDIVIALKQFKDRSAAVKKTTEYYEGEHNLKFASDKFTNAFGSLFKEFALNLCPAVCDAVRDKLVVTGFRVEEGEESLPEEAWKIWQQNRMGIRAGEIHKEAAINGDAYAIVWVDAAKKVTIYPNRAANVTVFYDEETPGKILWAAKNWRTSDKKFRLNLYYADRIEKYATKKASDSSALPEAKEFEAFGEGETWKITNPYGIVPVFHFANNGGIGSLGVSELKPAIPVQDALNKSVMDMLVAMEFQAYKQRWATGIEIEYDEMTGKAKPPFEAGVAHLWLTENPDATFGEFAAAELKPFLDVKDSFRVDIACVTGTPLYYFLQTGASFPSGESLKKAETRFIHKIRDRMESFGAVWEDVMSFALLIENKGKDVRLFTDWEDPAPLSENEVLTNLLLKDQLGIPEEQLWSEAGYGEADIKKMQKAKEEALQKQADAFNAGDPSLDQASGA